MAKLSLDLKVGETVKFDNGRIAISLVEKSGKLARLDIKMADDVRIETPRKQAAVDVARNGLTLKSS